MNARELKKLEQKCAEFTQKRDARLLKSLQEKLDKAYKIAESFPPSKIRKSTCSRKQNPEICQQLCKCNCVYGLALLIKSGYSISISEKIKYIITKGEPMEENKNTPETTVMSVEYSQAVQADALVESGFEMTQVGIAKVCKGVKLMHDGKLYRQLGFQNFEEYCQSKGFTKQYGNQLVRIAEMMEQENGNSVSVLKNLGVKKLYQLAMLEPEQREEIIQTVDVESVTVKELKSEISTLKQNNQQLEAKQKQAESTIKELQSENSGLKERRDELQVQIQELENRPVEVMRSTAELEEIERLKKENSRLEIENEALEEQRDELEGKLFTMENDRQEQAVSDAEEKRFAEFSSAMNQQLVEETHRIHEEAQEEISRANLQRDNAYLEVEKLKKQLAEQKEDSPEMKRFKVRIATLCDSIEQLVKFLCEHTDSAFLDKSETVLKGAENSLMEIRKQVQG